MIPALPDVGALRRFTNRVQSQPARQFLEIMKVFAYRSFGPEPFRLGLPEWWPKFNLNELGSACHLLIQFYMPD